MSPLEVIVEADWYSTGLHIVHKLSRPDRWVSYEANEPIAMLVLQRRGDLEAFEPVVQDLDPETAAEYKQWRIKRQALFDRIGIREEVHASEARPRLLAWTQRVWAAGGVPACCEGSGVRGLT